MDISVVIITKNEAHIIEKTLQSLQGISNDITNKNVALLNGTHAIILLIVSITLTLIGGFIPAKIASKKDPVEALRSE